MASKCKTCIHEGLCLISWNEVLGEHEYVNECQNHKSYEDILKSKMGMTVYHIARGKIYKCKIDGIIINKGIYLTIKAIDASYGAMIGIDEMGKSLFENREDAERHNKNKSL